MYDFLKDPPLSAAASPPRYVPLVFYDDRRKFRRLVFRGALLELFTIGFYRFWLATDIRRHIWSRTSVDGDALEYTGVARELFLGALLALAIFAPIYLIYFLVGIEAERQQVYASVPFGLFFILFSQFAIYRARRYRMTRTLWRGVRFWMTGSGWNYAFRSVGLMALVVLTLGLALPWREAMLERFKMRHSHYGDLQGRFVGTGWDLFKRGIWLWLALVLTLAGLVVLPNIKGGTQGGFAAVTGVLGMLAFFGAPFLYAAFKAIQWRWWISGIRFGDVSFSSSMDPMELTDIYWKVVGWMLLIIVVTSLVIGGVTTTILLVATGGFEGDDVKQRIAVAAQEWYVLAPIFLSYVLTALLVTAVTRIYLIHDIYARLAESTMVHNLATAEAVAARGALENAVGEGLADSLDIVGF